MCVPGQHGQGPAVAHVRLAGGAGCWLCVAPSNGVVVSIHPRLGGRYRGPEMHQHVAPCFPIEGP
jgi:hypothetical protein